MGIDPSTVRRHFERAAATYDPHAVLQRTVGERLLERIDGLKVSPATILDLGAGTGVESRALHDRYPQARLLAMDFALPMLDIARRRRGRWRKRFECVCGDAARLPLAENSVDLLYSSLMLQWCGDLSAVLAGFRRVMRPGGLILVSSFGPDTLTELREAWSGVDGRPHVGRFLDVQGLGEALIRAGFAEPVLDTDWITTAYEKPRDLLAELKAIGATNADTGRTRGLTGPGRLKAMLKNYEARQREDGRYPATWEVVYASAWAPEEGQPIRTAFGEEASISVEQVLGSRSGARGKT